MLIPIFIFLCFSQADASICAITLDYTKRTQNKYTEIINTHIFMYSSQICLVYYLKEFIGLFSK